MYPINKYANAENGESTARQVAGLLAPSRLPRGAVLMGDLRRTPAAARPLGSEPARHLARRPAGRPRQSPAQRSSPA